MLRILSKKTVAENSRFQIRFDEVTSGEIHIKDYLVVAPKSFNKEGISGVGVLPIRDDRVALLRIYRPAVEGEVWEIPRGFIDGQELSAEGARRELLEETGLVCDESDLIPLGAVVPEAGVMSARIAIFAARNCREAEGREMELGLKSLEFFSWDQVLKMSERSEIVDPCTIISVFRYQLSLTQGRLE